MKHHWLMSTVGALALVSAIAETPLGTARAELFKPPSDNTAPRSATGGASRGNFFTPPSDNTAPRSTTGGASRSSVFTPPNDNQAPSSTTGGASRGNFFTPPTDNQAPQSTSGGASRGNFFTPPTDNQAPQSASGGASRIAFDGYDAALLDTVTGNLYGDAEAAFVSSVGASMTAVVPDSFYGTTLEARPTILVYVPASNADTAVFSLKTEDKETFYQMAIAVPKTGGVIAVEMPAEAPELALGENYQWFLAMQLSGELTPGSPFVDGWIKRIEPTQDVASALAQTQGEALETVKALGANGIWYDTAAQLASMTAAQSDEVILGHWSELLESVGLADITAAPLAM